MSQQHDNTTYKHILVQARLYGRDNCTFTFTNMTFDEAVTTAEANLRLDYEQEYGKDHAPDDEEELDCYYDLVAGSVSPMEIIHE